MSWSELSDGPAVQRPRLAWLKWTLAILGIAVLAALAFPFFAGPDPEHHRRPRCGNNLHQIGMACAAYSGDYDECYPDRLEQLYPEYVDDARIFSCSSTRSSWQDFEKHCVTERSSSYVLLPGMRDDMPADFIVAYERPGNHRGGGFNVLHVGARVEWWTRDRAAEFERRMADQREKVRIWKPQGQQVPPATGPQR